MNFTPLYFTEGCKLETVYLVPQAVDLPVCLDCMNEGMVQLVKAREIDRTFRYILQISKRSEHFRRVSIIYPKIFLQILRTLFTV